ncbi:hypothetical protein [Longimicrobium terrae]|uniref:Uncharacterized protein n=1 Tax=Longimicrobium terrae TaxID=1639882 RepID=A0A841H174_9BACT|nr:hypothetical protein [Longimicrobium terrae]MBB4637308.1 hypothetical protein [Longimicrobium terrae]MBB6071706.1 hypothetical protein [Longimicrobium terrae]NNC28467.1 hypothetical protein [Longimicrobium terrae]
MKIMRLAAAAALLTLAACSTSPTAPAPAASSPATRSDLTNGQGMIGGGTRAEP